MQSLSEMLVGKTQELIDEIDNIHVVWLQEIQQEANRMFSRYLELKGNLVVYLNHLLLTNVFPFFFSDFNAEPELMPKTPSQKKNSRRRRVSVGRQEENPTRRRFVFIVAALIMDCLPQWPPTFFALQNVLLPGNI